MTLKDNKWVKGFVAVRNKVAAKLNKPLLWLETPLHGGYFYAAWSEGHGLYAMLALGLLVLILCHALFGVGE